MKNEDIPAIYGISTRLLTKLLREKGTMLGKIIIDKDDIDFYDPDSEDLVKNVSCKEIREYGNLNSDVRIIIIDCGVKNSIVRCFINRKVKLTIVPCDYDFTDMEYDGVFLSNGPGNLRICRETIEIVKKVINNDNQYLEYVLVIRFLH